MSEQNWDQQTFQEDLKNEFKAFVQALSTDVGDWAIKGFIDVYRNIYPATNDTKVISKLIELILLPTLMEFAQNKKYKIILNEHQNFYPDITFLTPDNTRIAVDLKSTYRTSKKRVSGFTLGSFTGYFRAQNSTKNIMFPYSSYAAHFVLGIIYTRSKKSTETYQIYTLDDLLKIKSIIKDFQFLLQEKWKIASDHPGSGNTKNIGSIKEIEDLVNGNGPFVPYDEAIFTDYWINYLTKDMARAIESEVHYRNLEEYLNWRHRAPIKLRTE